MEMLRSIVALCLLLPCLADETTDRLTRLESQLSNVFELTRRLDGMETENEFLKEVIKSQEMRIAQLEKANEEMDAKINQQHQSGGDSEKERKAVDHDHFGKRFVSDFQGSAVAFTAVVGPQQIKNLGPGQTVVYDSTITNVGGAYHNGSGIFTSPLSGVYVFNYAVMMDPGYSEYIELVKNGDHVIWNYGHAPGENHYVSASRTATVELQAGDQVWVRTQQTSSHGDGIIHGNTFTTFSGWLITIYE